MMYTLIASLALTLQLISGCSGTASGGPGCCRNLTVDTSFSMAAMSSVHGGAWSYAQIVNTTNTDKFRSLLQAVVPSGNDNEYNRFIYYRKDSDGLLGLLRQSTDSECVSGEPFESVIDSVTYKTYVLEYCEEYMVVFTCVEGADDNGFDYWYTLSNGNFTDEHKQAAQDVRDKYSLRGDVKNFDLSCL